MSLKDATLAQHILFYHAFTGCDTTSALFNQGKIKITTLLTKNGFLGEVMELFKNGDTDSNTIDDAGEQVLVALYGGQIGDTLHKLRYAGFGRSITKSKFNLACLPPTKAAAREHSFRAYHQIQKWLGNEKLAESWGWKLEANGLMPILTLQDPAPPELLKFITCRCEKGCGKKCSCRKAGLKCSEVCYFCQGLSCINAKEVEHAELDSEGEDLNSFMDQWKTQSNKLGQPQDSTLSYQYSDSQSDEDLIRLQISGQSTKTDVIDINVEMNVSDDSGVSHKRQKIT